MEISAPLLLDERFSTLILLYLRVFVSNRDSAAVRVWEVPFQVEPVVVRHDSFFSLSFFLFFPKFYSF